jgi:cell division protein FtsW
VSRRLPDHPSDAQPDREAAPPSAGPLLLRPLASYHLLLVSTLLLVALGLVMVFSASAMRQYATTGSLFATGLSRRCTSPSACRSCSSRRGCRSGPTGRRRTRCCSTTLGLLVLVLFVGKEVNGGRSWIPLPMGFNLQPAELAKLALALWGADLLVRKQKLLDQRSHLLVPLVPVAAWCWCSSCCSPTSAPPCPSAPSSWPCCGWSAPRCDLRRAGGGPGRGAAFLAVTTPHRMARLMSFRDPFADAEDTGYQAVQGFYALASGGLFGRGLGASFEKWSGGLPEAHTDFVFAIVGEELGLLGTLTGRSGCSRCWSTAASASPRTPTTPSCGWPRPASPPGSAARRSSTWAPSSACCRSPASRCPWSPSAARRCW